MTGINISETVIDASVRSSEHNESDDRPKSTYEALLKFSKTMAAGEWMSRLTVVEYCQKNGSTANERTIDNTLRSMTANGARSGDVRALGPGTEWCARNDVFFRTADNLMVRLYDPATDPQPVYHKPRVKTE
jgi:hypothetical protein